MDNQGRRSRSRLRTVLRGLFLLLLVLVGALGLGGYVLTKRQGLRYEAQVTPAGARVSFDGHGIPTAEAPDWSTLLRAQGYLHAGERLWQMDLMRRQGAGRLSEWFGEAAFPSDERRHQEDWEGVASRAAESLPPGERRECEDYAEGVNQFIREHRWGAGIEYVLLGVQPEPWRCQDSLLVLMSVAEALSAESFQDIRRNYYHQRLPEDWERFLYPDVHPWNHPLFEGDSQPLPSLPEPGNYLPATPIDAVQLGSRVERPSPIGSNGWTWRDGTSAFLANDPHLEQSVPQLWYAIRLKRSPEDWVVGASIPGLPGVVLGMNPHFAWGVTSLGEDIDDLLVEKLSPDGASYLAEVVEGREVWRPLQRKDSRVKVRGGEERTVHGLATHRGPLLRRPELGDQAYSRQWLPLKEGTLRLPLLALAQARDWQSFNTVMDGFTVPAVNVLWIDRQGNMGYRATGLTVERRSTGLLPQPAVAGEWKGIRPGSERPRLYRPVATSPGTSDALVSANQRVWPDRFGAYWGSDERADRIQTLLGTGAALSPTDMERMQLDTYSRYHHELARWMVKHARPRNDAERALLTQWRGWDGSAEHAPATFTEVAFAERQFVTLLLDRVRARYQLTAEERSQTRYSAYLQSAWVLTLLENEGSLRVFGLTDDALATALLDRVLQSREAGKLQPYPEKNAWGAQHPFAEEIPVLGDLFRVESFPQVGYEGLVRVETPVYGATVRLVWDLAHPERSTWLFPTGQSGHIGSPHFRSMQRDWAGGTTRAPVFEEPSAWGLSRAK
ncbi:penicillin amidase [Cystobacter fuscus]|uniref:Penicillin amidase n=1 Tax=Cystobacter fuscus TaxID=43 RepID=A0A250JCA8_9BACT|nr:penicillin acylase family protein [Cystobacter fuscus]ATB41112.1 penicillin amidase [Cystobacter fuscus]